VIRFRQVFALLFVLSLPVLAHEEDAGVDSVNSAVVALEPPVLRTPISPTYPPAALLEKREAHVHLELLISELGQVQEARVLESGGADFDAALLEVVRAARFTPAQLSGTPVRALVTYTHVFRLPDNASVDGGQVIPQAYSTTILGRRPISAASSFSVRDRDFELRPIGSVQDILRVTPGLVMVQHSGGGKANQYFMRGFDIDHGTDLALNIDGVPINMVSHAHGQGYADTNFIIPEVVERVEVTKGPYFSNQSDFATAGAVNMVSREKFEHSGVTLGVFGSPGVGQPGARALIVASPQFESLGAQATFAAELGQSNGPFEKPDAWNRYKLLNRLTFAPSENSKLSLVHMSYGSEWSGSGQIPTRAIETGLISRFGTLNPSEGGSTSRHQLALTYSLRPNESSELKALAYFGTYRFNMFSNFTFFLNDETQGDEIEQVDRRIFMGAKLSYRTVRNLGSIRFDSTVGADVRNDEIQNELWNSAQRVQLKNVRANDVHETLGGLFVHEEVTPLRWLRLNVGARVDLLSFAVDNRLATNDPDAPRSGTASALQFSPKASLVLSPFAGENFELDVYANYGHGFHSNDVRGVFSTPAVNPLSRAVGEEVGARTRLFKRFDVAAALWNLDLQNETVWIGDEGTTEVGAASNRFGVELETRFEILPWLAADLDVTLTKSNSAGASTSSQGLVLAPKQTWAGGLSAKHRWGPGELRGGLRFYGLGDRPASDDGELIAEGFTQFDFHLSYQHRWFKVGLDVENLFNGSYRSDQFATSSRLPSEAAVGSSLQSGFSCGTKGRLVPSSDNTFQGCEEVNFTPAYPLTARLNATLYFD
jgi:TonB family protein